LRLTFTDLQSRCQDGSGGDTSTASLTFFKQRLNTRYENVVSALPSWVTQVTDTFSTADSDDPQQYYYYPPNIRSVESLKITIGDRDYDLKPVFSYAEWNRLNAIDIAAGAIPARFFNRRDDFGIYPIPQDEYTATIVYNIRAGGMTKSDYTTATVTATENSVTITGAGTAFSTSNNVVAGEWFSLADATTGESRGSWYRIHSVDSTTAVTLESYFEEGTEAGASYIMGECPEIPADMHELLVYGALSDYFAEKRQDITKAQAWENKYYTGDFNNNNRDRTKVVGGLIKAIERYEDRNDSALVQRRSPQRSTQNKVFATDISS